VLTEALDMILEKEIGSVVIVNDKKIPVGVITTSDFLHLLIQGKDEKEIEISGRGLSPESQDMLQGFFQLGDELGAEDAEYAAGEA